MSPVLTHPGPDTLQLHSVMLIRDSLLQQRVHGQLMVRHTRVKGLFAPKCGSHLHPPHVVQCVRARTQAMVNPGFFGSLKNVDFEKLGPAEEQVLRQQEASSAGELQGQHPAFGIKLQDCGAVLASPSLRRLVVLTVTLGKPKAATALLAAVRSETTCLRCVSSRRARQSRQSQACEAHQQQ